MTTGVHSNKQFKQCCYYCGLPYSSFEHVPPKQLFKGFTCDKFKVPSCDKHNTDKSGSDNAVIKAMLIAMDTVAHKYPPKENVAEAIRQTKSHFSQVKRQVSNINKFTNQPPLTHVASQVQMENWIRQLTAAIIYNAIRRYDPGNGFDQAIVFSPNWVSGKPTKKGLEIAQILKIQQRQEESLKQNNWQSGWASGGRNYPAGIYYFEVTFEYSEEVVFRHHFFDSLLWYVAVRISEQSRNKILQKVLSTVESMV